MIAGEIEKKKLEEQIKKHNHAYFILNSPEISDEEFDCLVENLRKLDPNSPVLFLGSDLESLNNSKRIKHKRPMLSLDKCYDLENFTKWFEKIQGPVIAMPKIDGVACSIIYDQFGKLKLAATRGDGKEGEDITKNILRMQEIPNQIKNSKNLEIRGEIYLKLSRFRKYYKNQFSNPRNLTAGALKQKNSYKSAQYNLSFFAYDIDGSNLKTEQEKFDFLKHLGFEPIWLKLLDSPEKCQNIYQELKSERENLDYEIDGVVYRANQVSEQSRLGITAHHPKWALAYKYQGDSADTKLLDIDWSLGRTGVITPVAMIEPVSVSGALVSRASLHNLTQFKKLALSKGAHIEIVRRGGVIPHVESVLESIGDKYTYPDKCPSCQKNTKISGEFLICPEPDQCPDIIASRLMHFCSVLELEGFGEKIIISLIRNNLISEPADLFKLDFEELIKLDRMGEKLANKLLDQINQKRELELSMFLTALGFDELGPSIAEILANKFNTLDNLKKASLEDLKALYGIGESIAESVILGFKSFDHEINSLLELIRIKFPEQAIYDSSHKLFDKSLVFTGTLKTFDRKEAQKKVRTLGAYTPSTLSAQTDYLVSGEGKAGSKHKKAEKLGVKILNEEEFIKLL